MADVLRPALGREALAAQERDHLRLRVGRESERVADAAVVRQCRADEAEEGAKQATSAGFEAEPSSVCAPGRAWRNILRFAREHDVDAIVIGRRGLGGAERALIGSVSAAVVHHADRPVLVLPA